MRVEEHLRIGSAAHRSGDFVQARAAYDTALRLDPNQPDALQLLALIDKAEGHIPEAITRMRRSLEVKPQPAVAYNLGVTLWDAGKPQEAIESYLQAVKLKPDYADARMNLANSYMALSRYAEALNYYESLLTLTPQDANLYYNLGKLLTLLQLHAKAEEAYQRAIFLRPGFVEAQENLGRLYRKLNRYSEAVKCFETILQSQPARLNTLLSLAVGLQEMGKLQESQEAYLQAIAAQPNNASAWRGLSTVKRFTAADQDMIMQMQSITPASEGEQAELSFALGKAYDDLGDYAKAFTAYQRGNYLKRKEYKDYTMDAVNGFFNGIKKAYTADAMAHMKRAAAEGTELAWFVVGMPRSGTSLVEQILASHPLVYGAGELDEMQATLDQLFPLHGKQTFPKDAASLSVDQLNQASHAHIEKLQALKQEQQRYVIDKQPSNFQLLGLIHQLFPQGKIIHCMRDPLDTCLSIYKQYFTGRQVYAYDLKEMGEYYKLYQDLMRHWRSLLPADQFYEISYEALVEDVEGESRKLLAFCGLKWDARCLDFYRTEREVRTASASQVRNPIYRSSLASAEKYGEALAPLKAALNSE